MVELDPFLLGSVGFLFAVAVFIIAKIVKLQIDERNGQRRSEALAASLNERREVRAERGPTVIGGQRVARNRRRVHRFDDDFMASRANGPRGDSGEENEEQLSDEIVEADEHIGKKKLAKLQAKAERKAQREAELVERAERKKREEEREEQREKVREKERLEEEAEKERQRLEKEERQRAEEEEYQKMKEAFVVDEEGFDQLEEEETTNLMRDFVEYVKVAKVVNMDELAAHFKLRTEEAIDRLNYFLENKTLTGVMDDRGKFIYITKDELLAVAKFINQRGRVSLTELAQYSNKLINLETSVARSEEAISL